MRRFDRVAALAMALSAPGLAQAQGAKPVCVTRAEANALIQNAMPDAIEGIRTSCVATLPRTSYLSSQGAALVARYRAMSGDWKLTRNALLKMGGETDETTIKIFEEMPEDALKALISTAFTVVVAGDIKTADCPVIDRIVASLSPLPASNVAEIMSGVMLLAGRSKSEIDICPEG